MSTLGDRIKQLRKDNKLTQKELGEKLNVGKSTISQYENNINTPDIEIIRKISKIFDVSVDYLLGDTNIRKNQPNSSSTNLNELFKEYTEEDLIKLSKIYKVYKDMNLDKLDDDVLKVIFENAADSYKKIMINLKKQKE